MGSDPINKKNTKRPSTSLREGLCKFAEWYKEFYKNILRKEDSLTNDNEESTFR